MRLLVSLVFASILFHGAAQAKNDQVEIGPAADWVTPSELMAVPDDASGLVFVRRQDILVHLEDDGQLIYNGSRTKILHPNALQIGNISLSWKPASGAPKIHAIKVYRDDEVIDILSDISFEILRREDQLEVAMLDGILTAVARISDLRVGDELEIAFTTPANDLTLGNDNAGLLLLQSNPPLGRFRLGLNWTEGQRPNIKATETMTKAATTGQRSVDYSFDNPATISAIKDAPPRYNWRRIVEYSDFSDWSAISRHFDGLFESAALISNSSPLHKEIKRISSTHSDKISRAGAALKLVQQDVRYIYVGLDRGNLTPVSADETWKLRYGDCKGKSALLLGLLSELGIKAELVLANNAGADDDLDQRLPNPGMFDHILVRAQIDGKEYYLDGTLPAAAQPSLSPTFPYRWVLPLSKQGSSLERLPWTPATQPDTISLFEIDARNGFDGPVRKTSTVITHGIKGLEQQVQFSAVTPAQLLSVMRQNVTGNTWQSIDDVQWKYDQQEQASVLTIVGAGMVDWDNDGNGAKSLALPGGGFSPPNKRIRVADENENLPYYNKPEFTCHVTTVRLPTDTKSSDWTHKDGYNEHIFGTNYFRVFDLHDGSIRMIRSFRVENIEIDAASAARDNDRVASFDNSMGWIYYDPNDPSDLNYAVKDSKKVPATYDINWAADSSACLSANMAK